MTLLFAKKPTFFSFKSDFQARNVLNLKNLKFEKVIIITNLQQNHEKKDFKKQ